MLADDLRAPTRYPMLDGVRGVAVIAVVLYHAFRMIVLGDGSPATRDVAVWTWPLSTARFALDAFFVLSGFLIVASWTSARRHHATTGAAAWAFARKRAARILPAYWVSLLILVPLLAPHLLRSPLDLGLLATVQQYVSPSLPSEVNVVYWSLTTEVHFYVLAPLFAVALRRFGGWRIVVACSAVSLWWRYVLPAGMAASFTFGRMEQFAMGAALAGVVSGWSSGRPSRLVEAVQRRGAGVALFVALIGLGAYEGAVLDGVGHGLGSKLLHTFVAGVLSLLLLRGLTAMPKMSDGGAPRAAILEHPSLRLAGLVSYGVYLFHYPVLQYGLRAAGVSYGSPVAPARALLAVAALTAVSFAAGIASYLIIERRFVRASPPREEAATSVPGGMATEAAA